MPDWKVLSGLSIFLFCATAFGLFMLNPEISTALDKWQTLATGFLAIVAALIAFFGAVQAARLQADSTREAAEIERLSARLIHESELSEAARRVAASILVELTNAEIVLRAAQTSTDTMREIALAYSVRVPETALVPYDPRRVLARPIFDSLVSQIGVLSTDTAQHVLRAYNCISDVCRRPGDPENRTFPGVVMTEFEMFIRQIHFAHLMTTQAVDALLVELGRAPIHDPSLQSASEAPLGSDPSAA